MLVGRVDELGRIDSLLASARAGQAGALVLRGEPGIGKTALLAWANEQATGFQVLRATGVQSEAELASAGLHQLLRPLLPHLDSLPDAQRLALRAALALDPGTGTDPLAVYAGTLGLIAAGAEDGPLLCLIDDAHWLDAVSAEALAFAARRLLAEPVAMLFAARPEEGAFAAAALPQHEVSRLDDAASATLLAQAAEPLGPAAAEAVLRLAAGNPLAILELPHGLGTRELAGTAPLADPLPLPATVEAAFAARVRDLSPDGRWAIVLAAAAGTSGLGTPRRRPRRVPRARGGRGRRARCALPRVPSSSGTRSSAPRRTRPRPAIERRSAHAALAAALDPKGFADARAWHLGDRHGRRRRRCRAAPARGRRPGRPARESVGEGARPRTRGRAHGGPAGPRTPAPGGRQRGLSRRPAGPRRRADRTCRGARRRPAPHREVAMSRWDVEAEPWALGYRSFVRAAEEVAPLDPQLAAEMLSYAFDHAVQARPLHEAGALAERTWELLGRRHVPGAIGATTAIATWRLVRDAAPARPPTSPSRPSTIRWRPTTTTARSPSTRSS